MNQKLKAITLLLFIPGVAGGFECKIGGIIKTVAISCEQYQTLFPSKPPEKKKTIDDIWKENRAKRDTPVVSPEDSLQAIIDQKTTEQKRTREEQIKRGFIWVGMSKSDVKRAKGMPDRISDTSSAYGNRSTWMYRALYGRTFVHFKNNSVISITDHR